MTARFKIHVQRDRPNSTVANEKCMYTCKQTDIKGTCTFGMPKGTQTTIRN